MGKTPNLTQNLAFLMLGGMIGNIANYEEEEENDIFEEQFPKEKVLQGSLSD